MKNLKTLLLISISIVFFNHFKLAAQSIAYKLAVIEKGGYAKEDDLLVKRFNSLLTQLDNKYVDTQQQLGDRTVKAKSILEDNGISESLVKLMEGMNKIYDTSEKNKDYSQYITCYLIIRIQGRTHEETLILLQQLLNSMGIKSLVSYLSNK